MHDKISSLLDAELDRHEWDQALTAMERDGELRDVWDRYHLMGAVIRSELHIMATPGLADRIAQAIEQESPIRVKVLPMPGLGSWWRFSPRHAAGLALAASVAAVSIYGMRFVWPSAPPQSVPQLASTAADNRTRDTQQDAAHASWDPSLNRFLVQHSQFSPTAGMGVMPYVRIAGYDNNEE